MRETPRALLLRIPQVEGSKAPHAARCMCHDVPGNGDAQIARHGCRLALKGRTLPILTSPSVLSSHRHWLTIRLSSVGQGTLVSGCVRPSCQTSGSQVQLLELAVSGEEILMDSEAPGQLGVKTTGYCRDYSPAAVCLICVFHGKSEDAVHRAAGYHLGVVIRIDWKGLQIFPKDWYGTRYQCDPRGELQDS